MQTKEFLYELLVRGTPDGIAGAHQIKAVEWRKDDGSLLTVDIGAPLPLVIGSSEWSAVVGQVLSDALARNAELEARIAELEAQLAALRPAAE